MKIKPIMYCLLITYSLALLYYLFVYQGQESTREAVFFLFLSAIVMWIPGIIALFFSKREKIALRIFQKPDWMCLKAALCAMGLSLMGVTLLMPFHSWNHEVSLVTVLFVLGSGLISGLFINPFFALGEELFWRGYLHEKLKHLGIVKASLLIGSIWGIWHAPLIFMGHNYPGYPIVGVFMMCALCISLSPIFFWIRERGKSIFIPAILHGTLNSFGGLNLLLFQNPDPLVSGAGLGSIIAAVVVSAFLIWNEKRTFLSKRQALEKSL